ncbi:MAG: N-acetylneuraminate synthase family protein [Chloroflexi bacterium]|nr:N-acetylneuraminate synthase family protein [Chloroflexota bacterium]
MVAPAVVTGADRLLSGAFYVISPDELRKTRRFVTPRRTVGQVVPAERNADVDEEADLAAAEALAATRPTRTFEVGDRTIGGGACFVIAEAGVNHNGDPALAHRLLDAAADARADAVKFQTFEPAALAAEDAPLAEYQRAGADGAGGQREMLEALALPADAWAGLSAHARERGIGFLSSPFDEASAELLARLDVPAFKVPSGELTNLRLLERLAGFGRPLLVSTGMADMREVAEAVDAIAAVGDPPIGLFHCVSSYPAEPRDANLRAMATLRAAFGVPTGWSDHTPGIELPTAAAALGAALVEKHITLDRGLPGPDHAASLEPDEFGALVAAVRTIEVALGSGDKVPTPAELETAAVARKSLVWGHDLEAGAVVAEADVVALRPGTGLSPARRGDVVGHATARRVRAGTLVTSADVGLE